MWELIRWKRSLKKLFFYFFIYTGQKSETWLFRALHSHNPFYAPLRSVLNMCHWHIAPWHHVMYRKKELAVCSASSFKQKIKSAEGGTWTRTVLLPQAPEACASANSATSASQLYLYHRFLWLSTVFFDFFILFVFFLRFRQLTVFDPISIQVSDIKDRFLFSDIYLTESRMHFLFTLFLSSKRKESSISIELSYAVDGTWTRTQLSQTRSLV